MVISSLGVFSLIVQKEEKSTLQKREQPKIVNDQFTPQSGAAGFPEESGSGSISPSGQPVITPRRQRTYTHRRSRNTPTPDSSDTQIQSNDQSSRSLTDSTKEFNELRLGQIALNTPTKMRVGETELVKVHISDDLKLDLKSKLGDKVEIKKIKVSDLLKVILKGTNFAIEPIHEEEQILANGELVPWSWEVTPNESGEQKLFLIVYAKKAEGLKYLKTFDRTITVKVNSSDWWKDNWDKVIGIPIALGGTGFFAFIASKWRLTKNAIKKTQ
ncbi:MAG: hypothetical protein QNJ49_19620 [Mastigocoleus sp. MO_167.B18]|nr:hypothetical protein [Mastigocoleus sp. MO_167.B18]